MTKSEIGVKSSPRPLVVVTGAAKAGIGQAITRALVRSGFFVLGSYELEDAAEAEQLRHNLPAAMLQLIPVDHASRQSLADFVRAIKSPVSALVNSQFYWEIEDPLKFDHDLWDKLIAINLTAPNYLTHELANKLVDKGSVVTITSTEGFIGSFGGSAYAASKAAMHNIIKSHANIFGKRGIRVNAVAGGWIGGVMDTDEIFNKSRQITPLGRLGSPEEIAGAVLFLISDAAAFVNGTVLTVDGGYSGVDTLAKYEYQEHLAATDFHRFTSDFLVGRAGANDEIWAVSMLFPGEWKDDDPIKRDQFYAATRGAHIHRVFVVPPELKATFTKTHPLVRLHLEHPNIHGYRIDYEELKRLNPNLLQSLGSGWTALNSDLLILDNTAGPELRGTVITDATQLKELRVSFEQLVKLAAAL